MRDFKELYEDALETAFSGKLRGMIYNRELMNEALTVNDIEAFRSLYQRYTNLRNLGNAEFVDVDQKGSEETITKFTEIVNVTSDLNADLPYKCARCCSELWDFTKYCPHCGRLNINFKEEK